MLVDETEEDDSDVEMDDCSDDEKAVSVNAEATSAVASKPVEPQQFNIARLPNEVILNILEQCTPTNLFTLAETWPHVRALLRSSFSTLPRRLLAREQARLTSAMAPLDFYGMTIEQAVRVHCARFGKPSIAEFWPLGRSLADDFVFANLPSCVHPKRFQGEKALYVWIIEYILWVDAFANECCHDQPALRKAAQNCWIGRMAEDFACTAWDVTEVRKFMTHIQKSQFYVKNLPLPVNLERDILSVVETPISGKQPRYADTRASTHGFWDQLIGQMKLREETLGEEAVYPCSVHEKMGVPTIGKNWFFVARDTKEWTKEWMKATMALCAELKKAEDGPIKDMMRVDLLRAAFLELMEVCYEEEEEEEEE
jgi:hypothetical protein